MPGQRKPTTFQVSEQTRQLIDQLGVALDLTRADVLARAVGELAQRTGLALVPEAEPPPPASPDRPAHRSRPARPDRGTTSPGAGPLIRHDALPGTHSGARRGGVAIRPPSLPLC